jgi:hypothetical protein
LELQRPVEVPEIAEPEVEPAPLPVEEALPVETPEVETVEPAGEPAPVLEVSEQAIEAGTQEAVVPELVEEETSLDKLFTLRPEVFDTVNAVADDEEEDEEGDKKGKKGKKGKKKKFVEMEFDPDRGVMVVKHKRKRSGTEWDDNWEL